MKSKPVLLFSAAIVALLLWLSPLHAGEASFDVQGMKVTVSDRLTPPITSVPYWTKTLDAEGWAEFCRSQNDAQLAFARDRYAEALARGDFKPTIMHISKSTTSDSNNYKATDAFGTPAVALANGGYGGTGYAGFGGLGGFGYGAGTGGGQSSEKSTSTSYEYDKVYKNLGDNGGGPVTLINPYCRDYWMQHAK